MKTNQFIRVFFLASFVLLSSSLFAGNAFEITGTVMNDNSHSSTLANVILVESSSMKIVAQTTCKKSGEYVFQNIEKGSYILVIQKSGTKKAEERRIEIDENGTVVEYIKSGN